MEKALSLKSKKSTAIKIAILIFLLAIPLMLKNFQYGLLFLCLAEIYVIAVDGLDVLYGYSGQISFGTAGFFGMGAYISLLINRYTGIPVIFTMIIASTITCGVAMLLAYPASQLKGGFLSLSTIAFNHIVYQLVTRSPNGITGDFSGTFANPLELFGVKFNNYTLFFYFGLACVLLFTILKISVLRSRFGRALLAVKLNSHAAEGMGINVRRYKVYAFGMYGFYAAFAGTMYVHFIGYISPETCAQAQSVIFMVMLLFGGTCTDLGPVIGAVGIYFVKEMLSYAEKYQLLFYGIMLLVFILFLPTGVVGGVKSLLLKRKAKKEELENA